MSKKRTRYQVHVNSVKTGPKFGTMRAAKKWFQAQLRKAGKQLDFHPTADGQGLAIESKPSRFINAPDCPLIHGPYYTGYIYDIKEV